MAHLQEAAQKKINEICDRYVNEKTPLMMILSDIQKEYGYIPLEVQELVSARTGISVAEIYGVVTFYSFFSLTPKGKYVIGVCLGTACYVKGSGDILNKIKEIGSVNFAPERVNEEIAALAAIPSRRSSLRSRSTSRITRITVWQYSPW